jgi:hypothetical protein
MRRVPAGIRWFGAALLGLAGCYSQQPNLKPPPHPEEFILPPSDEARFSSYIQYPKELLNNDTLKKDKGQPGDSTTRGGMGRFGAGGSMPQ